MNIIDKIKEFSKISSHSDFGLFNNNFPCFQPKRTYYLFDPERHAKDWCDAIDWAREKYFRGSAEEERAKTPTKAMDEETDKKSTEWHNAGGQIGQGNKNTKSRRAFGQRAERSDQKAGKGIQKLINQRKN